MTKKDLAIVAITKGGVEIARRLRDHFPESDLLVSEKFAESAGDRSRRTLPTASRSRPAR